MEQTERYHSLDFLRAMAMYLGVILHVTILFGSPDRILWNFYGEYYQDPVDYQITWGIHLFRMQFFYLIAGFFAEMVYLKKGGKYFSLNRLKRILVPFIFGCLIIYPLTLGVFAVYNAELYGKSYPEQSLTFFLWEYFSQSETPRFFAGRGAASPNCRERRGIVRCQNEWWSLRSARWPASCHHGPLGVPISLLLDSLVFYSFII